MLQVLTIELAKKQTQQQQQNMNACSRISVDWNNNNNR